MYTPAWPHSEIKEVFPDIFFVMGTNIMVYNGMTLQHSRNMIIVRDGQKLTLINTVRLDDHGIAALNALGEVTNVVGIGAFHGRDDAFYLDQYQAKLWALPGMQHANNRLADVELIPDGPMPFPDCSLFVFASAVVPEGILHIDREGGILVTCDSLKNWLEPDPFFSQDSAKMYAAQGFFGPASISAVWKQATQVKPEDFARLLSYKFQHLLSAHGDPLLNDAYAQVERSIKSY